MFERIFVPLCVVVIGSYFSPLGVAGPMGEIPRVVQPVIADITLYNHTLLGEEIAAKEVVTRNRWGTPMPPDGKGGYSLIAPLNPEFIAQSLIIPPLTSGPVYRPISPEDRINRDATESSFQAAPQSGQTSQSALAPVEPTLPAHDDAGQTETGQENSDSGTDSSAGTQDVNP